MADFNSRRRVACLAWKRNCRQRIGLQGISKQHGPARISHAGYRPICLERRMEYARWRAGI
jgi:hypothetical protein